MRCIPIGAVLAIHSELLRQFGGQPGLRDQGLLESALARPEHLLYYEKADVFQMAAAYSHGIIKNHPFLDGNKRTGFMTAYSFLKINGKELIASEEDAVITMLGVADGSVDKATLALWFQENSEGE